MMDSSPKNNVVYVVTETVKSKDGKKSSFSESAYEDQFEAISYLRRAINALDDYREDNSVKWRFDFSNHYSNEIVIIGEGDFYICCDDMETEKGTARISIREVRLVRRE